MKLKQCYRTEEWGGPFAIKGVMPVNDARRCVEIGASAIIVSNHGGQCALWPWITRPDRTHYEMAAAGAAAV